MEAKSSLANSGGEVVARFTMMLTLRASAGLRVPTRGRERGGRCRRPEFVLLDARRRERSDAGEPDGPLATGLPNVESPGGQRLPRRRISSGALLTGLGWGRDEHPVCLPVRQIT